MPSVQRKTSQPAGATPAVPASPVTAAAAPAPDQFEAGSTKGAPASAEGRDDALALQRETLRSLHRILVDQGLGTTPSPLASRLREALQLMGTELASVQVAADMIPWDVMADRNGAIDDAAAKRVAGAVQFLLDADLPEVFRAALVDFVRQLKEARPNFAFLWQTVVRSGALKLADAVELLRSDDRTLKRLAFMVLAELPLAELGTDRVLVQDAIEKALTSEDGSLRSAALSAAVSIPWAPKEARGLAQTAQRMMTRLAKKAKANGAADDKQTGTYVEVLDADQVVRLWEWANPTADEISAFFLHAFSASTSPDQHLRALETFPRFVAPKGPLNPSQARALLEHSVKQWPTTLAHVLMMLPRLALGEGNTDFFVDWAAEFLKDSAAALAKTGQHQGEELTADDLLDLSTALTMALAEVPASRGEAILDEMWGASVPGVQEGVAAGLGALLTSSEPVAEWAEARRSEDLPSADAALQNRFFEGLHLRLAEPAVNQIWLDALVNWSISSDLYLAATGAYFAVTAPEADGTEGLVRALAKDPARRVLLPGLLARGALGSRESGRLIEETGLMEDPGAIRALAAQLGDIELSDKIRTKIAEAILGHDDPAVRRLGLRSAGTLGLSKTAVAGYFDEAIQSSDPDDVTAALIGMQSASLSHKRVNAWLDQVWATYAVEGAPRPAKGGTTLPPLSTMEGPPAVITAWAELVAMTPMPEETLKARFLSLLFASEDSLIPAAMNLAGAVYTADAELGERVYQGMMDEIMRLSSREAKVFIDRAGAAVAGAHLNAAVNALMGIADPGALVPAPVELPVANDEAAAEAEAPVESAHPEAWPTDLSGRDAAGRADAAKKVLAGTAADEVAGELAYLWATEAVGVSLGEAERLWEAELRLRIDPTDAIEVEGFLIAKNTDPNRDLRRVPDFEKNRLDDVPTTRQNRAWVARMWRLGRPLWLEGPSGAGKTAIIREMCARTETPFRRMNLNPYTTVKDLFGRYQPNPEDPNGPPVFVPGPVLEAALNGECLLLDETDLGNPDVLIALNGLLDARGYLNIPGYRGEPIRPHKNFRIFATGNGMKVIGRGEMNRAFLDRWTKVKVKGLTTPELTTIVAGRYGDRIHPDAIQALMRFHQYVSTLAEKGLLGGREGRYAFSLRDLFKVCHRMLEFGPNNPSDVKASLLHMRREIEEVYCAGLVSDKDRAEVLPNLDTLCVDRDGTISVTHADVEAMLELTEVADQPGAYQLAKASRLLYNGRTIKVPPEYSAPAAGSAWAEFSVRPGDNMARLAEKFGVTGDAEVKAFETKIRALNEEVSGHMIGDVFIPYIGNGKNVTEIDYVLTKRAAKVLYQLAKAVQMGENAELVGNPGCGKTQIVRFLAYLMGQDFYDVPGDSRTSPRDLNGRFHPDGRFRYGNLAKAWAEGAFFLFDEHNAVHPAVIESTNPITDGDEWYRINQTGEELRRKPTFRWTCARNLATEKGVNQLSVAFGNRMTSMWVPPLDDPDEMKIILRHLGNKKEIAVSTEWADALVDMQAFVNDGLRDGSLGSSTGKPLGARAMAREGLKFHGMRTLEEVLRALADVLPRTRATQFADIAGLYYQFADEVDAESVRAKAKSLSGQSASLF